MKNEGGDTFNARLGSSFLSIQGPNALLIIMLVLLCVAFTYINLNALESYNKALSADHHVMTGRLETIANEAKLIAYLVSLSEDERPRVILPPSLKARIWPQDRQEVSSPDEIPQSLPMDGP